MAILPSVPPRLRDPSRETPALLPTRQGFYLYAYLGSSHFVSIGEYALTVSFHGRCCSLSTYLCLCNRSFALSLSDL